MLETSIAQLALFLTKLTQTFKMHRVARLEIRVISNVRLCRSVSKSQLALGSVENRAFEQGDLVINSRESRWQKSPKNCNI